MSIMGNVPIFLPDFLDGKGKLGNAQCIHDFRLSFYRTVHRSRLIANLFNFIPQSPPIRI